MVWSELLLFKTAGERVPIFSIYPIVRYYHYLLCVLGKQAITIPWQGYL
jgi:hypothetical protein